jgi:hypothetical protein
MIIKLTKVEDGKLGSKAAKVIHGEKVADGTAWKKPFFANQKDLRDKLMDFEMGEIINVVMKQDGDFWNISDLLEATDEDIEKAEGYGKGKSKFNSKPADNSANVRRPDGGSRGDDTNRSAAVYLARDIVSMTKVYEGLTAAETAALCCELADRFVYPYIKDGAVPIVESEKKERKTRVKRESADPLAPPVED